MLFIAALSRFKQTHRYTLGATLSKPHNSEDFWGWRFVFLLEANPPEEGRQLESHNVSGDVAPYQLGCRLDGLQKTERRDTVMS